MGHIRSKHKELFTLTLKDFKANTPKKVRAVRVDSEIYFMDEQNCLYSARVIRREKWSIPFTRNMAYLMKALLKLGYLTQVRYDEIWNEISAKEIADEIAECEDNIKRNKERLAVLKAKK